MKKQTEGDQAEMRSEYDFSGGVRGKYARNLRERGYIIRVYNDDGTFTDTRVAGENTVVIAPDVWEYFPSSEAVNNALRTLITLVPKKPAKLLRETSSGKTYSTDDSAD